MQRLTLLWTVAIALFLLATAIAVLVDMNGDLPGIKGWYALGVIWLTFASGTIVSVLLFQRERRRRRWWALFFCCFYLAMVIPLLLP